MPKFSDRSIDNLSTCNIDLILLFTEVIQYYDCSVVYGFRDKKTQDRLYDEGKSMVKFPGSKHNHYPSSGVDVQPYPIDIKLLDEHDLKEWGRFYNFIGYVRGFAQKMGIEVRTGSDWDGDFNLKDQNFDDLWHWEVE